MPPTAIPPAGAAPTLAAVMAALTEAVVVLGLDWRVQLWLGGAERLTGWSATEAIGRRVDELLGAPMSPDESGALLGELRAPGVIRRKGPRVRKDGRPFWVEQHLTLLAPEGEAPPAVLCVSRDVTAAREAESAGDEGRRALEASLAAAVRERDLVLEHSPIALAKIRDRRVAWANSRCADLFRHPVDGIVGVASRAFYPDDESFERVGAAAYGALDAGEAFAIEQRMLRGDGSLFWCRMQGRLTHQPGELICSFEDISDRKHAEQRLAESDERLRDREDRLQRVLAGIDEGYSDWTPSTGHVERSPRIAEMLGLRPGDLEPRLEAMTSRLGPEDAARLVAAQRAVVAGERDAMDVELQFTRADGARRWLRARSRRALDRSGRVTISGTVADVTERHEAEARIVEELRRNEALVSELRAALEQVKELRGLLPICMYCHKVRDDDGYWERIERYIGDRTDATFSHGLCPDCATEHFPE